LTPIPSIASLLLASAPPIPAADVPAAPPEVPARLTRAIVGNYAALAHTMYVEVERSAGAMRSRIGELLAGPSPEALRRAREAWVEARQVYGQSEVLRFYGGPIDDPVSGVETLVNAWPVDEAYIDSVRGDPGAGIINAPQRHPNLNTTMLSVWNQRGGEANVSTGWHAIEFLLWGQDLDASGPGSRPHTDFVPGAAEKGRRLPTTSDNPDHTVKLAVGEPQGTHAPSPPRSPALCVSLV
jgi:putative iron-regulated protein